MKLTVRDRLILCVVAILIGVFGCAKLIWQPLSSKIIAMKNERAELKLTLTDKSPLEQTLKQLHIDNESLTKQISKIKGADTAKTLTKEEFLVFISNAAQKNDAEIIRFNDLGMENQNGVWKATFDFQIRGTLSNINTICEKIDMTGIRYSIGSMSLRQNEKYPYLERSFDQFSNLEWYIDPVKPKEDSQDITPNEESLILPHEEITPTIPVSPDVLEESIPDSTPTPSPTPTLPPMPDTDNGDITDRLNELLELTNYSTPAYKFMFLSDSINFEPSFSVDNDNDDVMTIAITLQLIMYEKPIVGASIIITEEGESDNAIL